MPQVRTETWASAAPLHSAQMRGRLKRKPELFERSAVSIDLSLPRSLIPHLSVKASVRDRILPYLPWFEDTEALEGENFVAHLRARFHLPDAILRSLINS